MLSDHQLIFAEERETPPSLSQESWKIMIVDDEEEIHQVTMLILDDLMFDDKPVRFLSAYSAFEAQQLLTQNPDIALILLDVVMEAENAGLSLVKYIRQHLDNHLVRIVLRTGQPGQAPEERVIVEYDINDYKAKAELTARKLFTTVFTSLRAFQMLKSLEAQRMETERFATASARFVPREFLHVLKKDSIVNVELGDQIQQEMTIMFADVRSFTSLSENMKPRENFEFINELLKYICPPIREHHGFVDKFLGDGVMALFPHKADDAVQAAISMRRQLARFNRHRKANDEVPVQLGIGLHTGMLMLGTIGEAERMDGTVISDAVNLASRVEALTKRYGAGLVISEQTLVRLDNPTQYSLRFVDKVQVKGKQVSVSVFEIFDGDTDTLVGLKLETKIDFEKGLSLYRQRRFPEASVHFNNVIQRNPQDDAARLYLTRAAHFMVHGVPTDWEGIEILLEEW